MLFFGGFLGLAVRVVFWVISWNLVGENLHWILHALTAWIIGDLIASIVIKIFVR